MTFTKEPALPAASARINLMPVGRPAKPKANVIDISAAGSVVSETAERVSDDTIGARDSYAVTAIADIIDRSIHATAARFTLGLSPAALNGFKRLGRFSDTLQ